MAPHADACEEVALHVSGEVVGCDIQNAPFIHVAGRDVAGGDQVAQPLRCVGVDLVVVGGRHYSATSSSTTPASANIAWVLAISAAQRAANSGVGGSATTRTTPA